MGIMMKKNILTLYFLIREIPKIQILFIILNSIVKTFSVVSLPFFIERVLKLTSINNYHYAIYYTVLYYLIVVVAEIIYIQNTKRNYTLYNDIRRSFNLKIHEALMNMNYNKFEDSSELQKAFDAFEGTASNDCGIEGIYHVIFDFGWKLISVIIFSLYFGKISFLIVLVFCLSALLNFVFQIKSHNIYLKNIENIYSKKRTLVYFTYDISDISYGKEKRIYKFFRNIQNKYNKVLNDFSDILNKINTKQKPYFLVLSAIDLAKFVVIFFLLYKSYLNNGNIEVLIASLTIIFLFSSLLNSLIEDITFIFQETKKVDKVFGFINNGNENNKKKIQIESVSKIEFKNVYFRYPGNLNYSIKNCSFSIKKGEKVALIGLNGSGKTTLTKLLLGLYIPTKGRILINDYNIADIDLDHLYDSISYVEQEHNLVSIKICDFIAGSKDNCDREKVILVLKEVNLLDKIQKLPNGIDTVLTKYLEKDGAEFSGGEIQKLYIARSMYRDKASLYIFDEPTSSLDFKTEKNIYNSFNTICKDNVSLFITHKVNTTDFCDKIMIMKDGMIIEEGSKDYLIKNSTLYNKILDATIAGGQRS